MNLKKLIPALLALLLLAAACLPALAAEVGREYQGSDFTFTIPQGIDYDLGTAEGSDPAWTVVGVTNGSGQVEQNEEYGVISDLYSKGGTYNIKVMSRSNDATMKIFNLKDMTEEDRAQLLEELITAQSDEITIERSYLFVDGQPFYYLRTDGHVTDYGEAHEITVGTIFNGHTLNFNVHSSGTALPDELVAMLDELVGSVRITKILTVEEAKALNAPPPFDWAGAAPMLIVAGVLVIIVAAPIVYIPLRSRVSKKRKAEMAARLAEHERLHHGNDWDPGELRFANATDCTGEAIHTFSMYHAYVKQIASVILGAFLCGAILISVFVFSMEWWLKVAAVGATVYFAYRLLAMPTTIERIQRNEFKRGLSSTAQYMFYEDGFRVSGVQPSALYPYFRITAVRRNGQYVYLYYGVDNAYLVDQYGFSQGEMDAFIQFIKEKTVNEKK